jgi:ribonuclease P protein component
MMPTVGRLKTRPQFLKVAAAKRKWVTPGLVLQAARRQHGNDRAAPVACAAPAKGPHSGEAEVRVGFTVTRKVGNAVERNRVKRRLRAVAAEVFPRLGRSGTDYVVVGRVGTLTRRFDALRADLEQAVLKLDRGQRTAGKRGPAKEASQ